MYTNVWLKFGNSQPFRIKRSTANQIIEDLKEELLTQHSILPPSIATRNILIMQGGSILDPGSLVPQGTTSNDPLKIQVEENQGPPGNLLFSLDFLHYFYHF
jgi:hypothetical protein